MSRADLMRMLAITWLLLAWAPAHAAIITVTATPPAANVPIGQSGSVQLRWRITATIPTNPAAALRVRSDQGVFRAGGPNGPVLGIIDRTIQSRLQPTPQQVAYASVPESVLIPARVLLRAQALGVRQVVYSRSFVDGGGPPAVTGTLTLNLTGGLGGSFGVTRLTLRFADGRQQKIVAPGAETVVLADISNTGSGRLIARWEVAEPVTTRGKPVFRTLSIVRRQLIGSGARTTIRSPELPTRGDGAYLVRLRIINPQTGFDTPVLRYFVNPALTPTPAPATLVVRAPVAGADYADGMRFAWRALAGAAVYRLEFHDRPPPPRDTDPIGDTVGIAGPGTLPPREPRTEPVSGIVVTAAVNAVGLSPLALTNLAPGQSYWWRVVAFDSRGRLIGRSPLRRLNIPPSAP